MMKYSFLMPYYFRAEQLQKTLKSFSDLYRDRKDYEVIIGEDIKNIQNKKEHQKLLDLIESFIGKINIVCIQTNFENCYNPAPIFNLCAEKAKGIFLILTSPEVLHKNNILQGFDIELSKDKNIYIIPSCECVKDLIYNGELINYSHFKWYHHTKHRRSMLHWCTVLSKDNYDRIGGFDNEFRKGIACEDNDFLERVKEDDKLKIIMRDDLETLHIWHGKPRLTMDNYKILHKINSDYCDKKRMEKVLKREGIKIVEKRR